MSIKREICVCGHRLDEHDSDDEGDLGCTECDCPIYVEDEDD